MKRTARMWLGLALIAPAHADETLSRGWVFGEQGGAALYANVCAACHQADGEGASGAGAYPALAHNQKLASADYVLSVIVHGLRGMPPVGSLMTDAQVADVANYARTHFGNDDAEPVTAADVATARAR